MQLGRRHGDIRFEAACTRALALGFCHYQTVKNILSAGQDRLPLEPPAETNPTPTDANIRDAEYYATTHEEEDRSGRTDARQAQRHEARRDGDPFQQQLQTGEAATLGFEERFGLLADAEWTAREQRKLQRHLHTAKLRYPASLEAIDFTHPRRLNRQQILTLGTCAWLAERHNLIVTGPCGIGKSFLACALVERACRRGFTARYVRMPRLLHELAVGPTGTPSSATPIRPTRSATACSTSWAWIQAEADTSRGDLSIPQAAWGVRPGARQ